MRGKLSVTIGWLLLWSVIGGVGSKVVSDAQRRRHAREQSLDAVLAAQAEKFREELSLKEQDLRRATRAAAARRKAEYEAALGGPVAAAFKNPEFSLREALQRAAEACAPTNTIARAEVDRFTEFSVTIHSGEALTTNQMVAMAHSLLPAAKEYLDSLRFSAKGTLVAELDREDIEFVEDWARVSDQRIARLLPREVAARITEDPKAIERLRDEQRISQAIAAEPGLREKTQGADRKLRKAIESAYGELRSAFESVGKSAFLSDIRSLRDLDRREKDLRDAVEHVRQGREFWMNPAKAWENILDAEGISGDLRGLLIKSFPGILRNNPARTAKLFERLDGEIISCRELLRTLTAEGDEWRFAAGGGVVAKDEAFFKRFEEAQLRVREDTLATESALHAWNEAVGP